MPIPMDAEIYYAQADVPFPESELNRLPENERTAMLPVIKAQEAYCQTKLADHFANGETPHFTTDAMSKKQRDERRTSDQTFRPDYVLTMRKIMPITFHLKRTADEKFEAVAFEALGSRERISLKSPIQTNLKQQEATVAAATPKDTISRLRGELMAAKQEIRQLKGEEPATIAAPVFRSSK